MGLLEKGVNAPDLCRGARTYQNKQASNTETQDAVNETNVLTFVTSEGERIVFEDMDIPVGKAAALAGEEALGKIWNRPAEDLAWRDI
ncbi:MAG: hypothetical protein ACRYFS_26170 [Janthinobacterium lividum]